jgi:hypothetical protein
MKKKHIATRIIHPKHNPLFFGANFVKDHAKIMSAEIVAHIETQDYYKALWSTRELLVFLENWADRHPPRIEEVDVDKL